ncbi:MAG: ParB N-terminal domain-containing protein [Microbacterium sp.]|uniref:ParB N-terminal domain-containing protein n=1 Tax=Microbacterium sp. TaxID=51671 RepID=UPI001ACD3238|nr:ParB N-terminal domain-containing protein [Microbacterium sp.]MBN9214845.1 ParB N-terminal domain-containing protein [Microbacterium sp.]
MIFTARGTSHATVLLRSVPRGADADVRELADSIAQVGLLRPLVIDKDGEILDGGRRARALALLGATEAPAIRLDLSPTDLTQQSTLRAACKAAGVTFPSFVGASRATLDRVDKVVATAADITAPVAARLVAAEGITRIAGGASANGVLTQVTAALADDQSSSRYPELAHLDRAAAMRMAEYLDAITDPAQRELELSVLRMAVAESGQDKALSMSVYTHMQDLAAVVDQERAHEVAAALAAAITGSALTPALRERCIEVADQLERTAGGIRAAMTLTLEHA